MKFYITDVYLNIRQQPNGSLLGTIRPNTIVYALSDSFLESESNITWLNIFAYDLNGKWHNGYSAISKDNDVFLKEYIPHVKLSNPYKDVVYSTQLFGENGTPLYNRLGMYGHNGLDLWGKDKFIYSVNPGYVTTGYDNTGYGNYVIITGATLKILYAHLNRIDIQNGAYVYPGTPIGVEGNTTSPGSYMGQHLHIELRLNNVDNNNNGFLSRIDILPYLDWSNIIFPTYCSILNKYK